MLESLSMKPRELPPRLHFKDGAYYHVYKNKWRHMGYELDVALENYAAVEGGITAGKNLDRLAPVTSMGYYIPRVYWSAKKNARTRRIQFDLTREEFDFIVARAAGKCEVTGIPFALMIRATRRPWAPSLDRINAAGHYHLANCRLVCGIVNAAMSDWGEDVFWSLVRRGRRPKIRGRQAEVLGRRLEEWTQVND